MTNQNQVDRLKSKLKVLGFDIIDSNDFGIVYKKDSNSELNLLKITDNRTSQITGFDNYSMTKYFISTSSYNINMKEETTGLYIKDLDINIIKKYIPGIIYSTDGVETIQDKNVHGELPIIGFKSYNKNKLILINKLGKSIDISQYSTSDKHKTLGIFKHTEIYGVDTGLYIIGYGSIRRKLEQKAINSLRIPYTNTVAEWFIKTDINFRNIQYNEQFIETDNNTSDSFSQF